MAAKKTFEENMARLEALVAQLERGDAPLSESLALFEEGTKLVSQCRKELDTAEQKAACLPAARPTGGCTRPSGIACWRAVSVSARC